MGEAFENEDDHQERQGRDHPQSQLSGLGPVGVGLVGGDALGNGRLALQAEGLPDFAALGVGAAGPVHLFAAPRMALDLFGEAEGGLHELGHLHTFVLLHFPIELAVDPLHEGFHILEALVDLALVQDRLAIGPRALQFRRGDILRQVPVAIALYQPVEAVLRVHEQVLAPAVLDPFDNAGPAQVAHADERHAAETALGAQGDPHAGIGLLQGLQVGELALAGIQQAAAAGAAHPLGFIWGPQRQGGGTMGAGQAQGLLLLGGGRGTTAEFELLQVHLAAREEDRRILGEVEGGEGAIRPAEICKAISAAKFHRPRDFPFGGMEGPLADLAHDPAPLGAELQFHPGPQRFRQGHRLAEILSEGQVGSALGLRQPAPASILEGEVPLVPEAPEGMLELRTPHHRKAVACVVASHAQPQGRVGVHQGTDLPDELGIPVCAGRERLAVFADRHHRAGPEGERRAAGGTIGLIRHGVHPGIYRDDGTRVRARQGLD